MIHLVKKELWTRAGAAMQADGFLEKFKSRFRSDWALTPMSQLPAVYFEWGGGMSFTSFENPLAVDFDLSVIIKTKAVQNPDDGQEAIEKLFWDADATNDYGLLPFLLTNRSIPLPPTDYLALLTPKVGEPIAEQLENAQYTFSLLTIVQVQIQRAPIRT